MRGFKSAKVFALTAYALSAVSSTGQAVENARRPPENLTIIDERLSPECIDFKSEPITAAENAERGTAYKSKKILELSANESLKMSKQKCKNQIKGK
jgi:hypothetical protein